MTNLNEVLSVSVREASDIMFEIFDEVIALEQKVYALEEKLFAARVRADISRDTLKSKRAELKAAGYSFDLRNGVYKTGQRPEHKGMIGSIRDQEGY